MPPQYAPQRKNEPFQIKVLVCKNPNPNSSDDSSLIDEISCHRNRPLRVAMKATEMSNSWNLGCLDFMKFSRPIHLKLGKLFIFITLYAYGGILFHLNNQSGYHGYHKIIILQKTCAFIFDPQQHLKI